MCASDHFERLESHGCRKACEQPYIPDKRRHLAICLLAFAIAACWGWPSQEARAGAIFNCSGNANASGTNGSKAGGGWGGQPANTGEGSCQNGTGVILGEDPNLNGGLTGAEAYVWIGKTNYNTAGTITMYAPTGYNFEGGGQVTFSGQKLTGIAAGTISATSTDAVNGSQLFNFVAASSLVQQSAAGQPLTVGAATDGTVVNFTGTAGNRVLTGVAAGGVSSTSVDVINGSQLYNGNLSIANALGGGAAVNADGTLGAPSYLVGGTTFNNVGGALGNLDTRTTQNTTNIATNTGNIATNTSNISALTNQVTVGTIGLVQQSASGQPITVGAATNGASVDFTGTSGSRVLTGVAAGSVSATSVDAVNGSQLFATNTNVTNLTNQIGAGSIGLVQQANGTGSVTVAAATGGATVDFTGTSGSRLLTGVAAGSVSSTSVDAINGAQLFNGNLSVANALGGGSAVNADGTLSAPNYAVGGTTFTNVGGALENLDTRTTQNAGNLTTLTTQVTTGTIGLVQQAGPGLPITVGAATDGTEVNITGTAGNRLLTGVSAGSVSATSADAINGSQLFTTNTNVSNLASQLNTGTIGLVQQSAAGQPITVGAATDGTIVNFTGTAGSRVLTGVGSGAVSATSVDAINGSQLFNGNQSIATALGGGAAVNASGTLSAPSYSIGGSTFNNVGSALGNLDTRTTQNTTNIATNASNITTLTGEINGGTVGLVQQSATGQPITVGAATNGTVVNFTGSGGNRVLTGVFAGAVGATSVDAINGSQLFNGNQSIATALGGGAAVNADGTLSAPSYSVGGTTFTNVGGALGNLDTRTTQNTTNIATNTSAIGTNTANIATLNSNLGTLTNQIGTGTIGLVQQSAAGQPITVGGATDGTIVNFTGTAGSRVLTGVGPGVVSATSVDAINGSQLFNGNQSIATALGGGAAVNANGTLSAPSYSLGGSTFNNVGSALGNLDTRTSQNTTDINTLSSEIGSTTVGLVQQSAAGQPITVGANTDGTVVNFTGTAGNRTLTGVAAGSVSATSVDAINGSQLFNGNQSIATALGGGASVNTNGTIAPPSYNVGGSTFNNVGSALGNLDTRTTQNTTDINTLSSEIGSTTVGLVQQSAAGQPITVGANTDGTVVNFTGTAGNRTLTGVAAGSVSATSVDAINGSQLYSGNQSIATALGGGAAVNANGTLSAPSYSVGGSTFNNVGGALGNLDTRTTQNTTNIATNTTNLASLTSAVTSGTIGLVQQSATGQPITVGAATDGTTVNFTGTAGSRVLTGVGPGVVSATSVDAINGSQLFTGNQSIATALGGGAGVNANGTVSAPSYAVGGTTFTNVGGALGNLDTRTTQNTTSINTLSSEIGSSTIGLVQQSAAGQPITVGASTDGTVVNFAGTAGSRVLTGVGAGSISASSIDAINGSQLYNGNQSIASALGGGAAVNANGTLSAPSYSLGGSTFNNVGSALGNLDTRTTQNTTGVAANSAAIANLQTGSSGLVQQAGATQQLTVGANTGGSSVSFSGTTGPRVLSGVAAGVAGTDAANMTQLGAVQAQVTDGTRYIKANGLQNGTDDAQATGTGASAVGPSALASGTSTVAIGQASQATIQNAVAVGSGSQATGTGSTALGATTLAVGPDDTAVGNNARVGADLSTAVGANSSVAVGATSASAFGSSSTVSASSGTALGSGASVTALNAVALGAGSVANQADTVSIGAVGAERRLVNLAAGTIGATSTDGVNGSQIFADNQNIAGMLGGGSSVDASGNILAPHYQIGGTTFTNVGSALGNLDTRTTQNTTEITLLSQQIASPPATFVVQPSPSQPITVGAATGGTAVNFTGTGGNRVLTGVAAGGVSANSVDVINGGQLYSGNQSIANALGGGASPNAAGTISAPTYTIGGNTFNNVGGALGNLDTRTSQNTAQLAGLAAGTVGLVQQSAAGQPLTVGGSTDGSDVIFSGTAGARTLSGVAAGVSGTDAVNVSQLDQAISGVTAGASPYFAATGAMDGSDKAAATGTDSVAAGRQSQAQGNGSTAVGASSFAAGPGDTAVGNGAHIGADQSTAVGANSSIAAGATSASAFGSSSAVSAPSGTAVGSGANVSATNAVAVGANSTASRPNTVSVGATGAERQVVNVAPGTQGTDAVNVTQMQQQAAATLTSANQYTDSQVSQAAAVPTQAINALRQEVNDQFHTVNQHMDQESAMSAAMVNMAAGAANVQTDNRVGAGVGVANGQLALAVGFQRQIRSNVSVSVGAAFSQNETSVGAGLGVGW